jgi:opacity protein-like surface antigen
MIRVIAFLSLFAFASVASAQQTSGYARNGLELGAGFGLAGEDFSLDNLSFDDTAAANMIVGYRFHPHLGVEGRFEHTFNFDANVSGVRATVWSLTANGLVYFTTGQFQPYFELGIGVGQGELDFRGTNSNTTDAMGRVGLGLDSYVTPNIAIAAEFGYDFGFGDLSNFNYWTMGAQFKYRF